MIISPSSFDDAIAQERGRLLAAQAIANNRDQRERVEAVYGLEYCKRKYPEAYQSGFGKLLDKLRFMLR